MKRKRGRGGRITFENDKAEQKMFYCFTKGKVPHLVITDG